ncbi:ABC transporter substrate-binding protein [Halorubrum kocurii]|uniref:Sulfonate/nitrate/taurine ABC transporter extracellular binding protein n=1 Tax=Halorubrum kocurii JCM 14978 TaxID=1230456 RepID=M0NKT5_9EURY|nr:ABC transporter substrate-binding protein [Halorubrum kocurii]EMA57744.1 sulfonate/nitrate/taurine ABC transporter extracellular binding protein [Halorubrum kocurii JCM 14978]
MSKQNETNYQSTERDTVPSRRKFLGAAGATTAAALGGCLGSTLGSGGVDTVTFGTLPIATVVPVLIAQEEGYFEDRNIEVERERINGVPLATPELSSGDIDVAAGSFGASIANSIAQDVPIRIAADMAQHYPNVPGAARVWAREDIYTEDATFPEIADAVDGPLSVAHNAEGGSLDYILGRVLAANDMSWSDVEVSEIQFSNMVSAMMSGDTDVCIVPDPLGLALANNANAGHVLYGSAVAPRMQIAAYFFGGPFIEQRTDVAVRWLEGYLKGVRKYYEMGSYPNDEVATIINDAFDINKQAIKSSVPAIPNKNGRVNQDDVMRQQEYHACRGYIDETVDRSTLFDTSLLSDALDSVGRVSEAEATPSPDQVQQWGENAPQQYTPIGEISQLPDFPSDTSCQ